MPRRRRIEHADDFVLDETQSLRAAAAVTVPQQHGLRAGARRDHLGLQQLRHRRAKHILAAGMFFGQRVDRGGDPHGIETLIRFRAVLGHDKVHDLPRYRTAQTLSRMIVRQQQFYAGFAALWAKLFSSHRFRRTYFLVDLAA